VTIYVQAKLSQRVGQGGSGALIAACGLRRFLLICYRWESRALRVRFLQRGRVEKCKTWRTRNFTDFPDLRHTLGIRQWCSQCVSEHCSRSSPK
jgi:hypothetical protein